MKLMLVRMLMKMMQKAVDEDDASENVDEDDAGEDVIEDNAGEDVDEDDAEGCSIMILVTGLSASSSSCYRGKYDG